MILLALSNRRRRRLSRELSYLVKVDRRSGDDVRISESLRRVDRPEFPSNFCRVS